MSRAAWRAKERDAHLARRRNERRKQMQYTIPERHGDTDEMICELCGEMVGVN